MFITQWNHGRRCRERAVKGHKADEITLTPRTRRSVTCTRIHSRTQRNADAAETAFSPRPCHQKLLAPF